MRLYRRRFLQENTRWKALDEIYKIYILLHRSDLKISAKIVKFSGGMKKFNLIFSRVSMKFAIFLRTFDEILPQKNNPEFMFHFIEIVFTKREECF